MPLTWAFSRSITGVPATPGLDVGTALQLDETLEAARYSGMLTATPAYVLMKDRTLAADRRVASFR